MLFVMIIKFYTSRVVLDVLGVEDFGIYNVVGGIVVLFTFINSVMVTSTQRFLNYAMGEGDQEEVSKIFTTAVRIHLLIALILVLLSETLGLWYFYKYLVIPDGRQTAAQWVLQTSIILAGSNIIRAPYNAAVIAHERMSFFAVISVLEAILGLLAIYLVKILNSSDHLIAYSIWMLVVGIVITLLYMLFCYNKFTICRNRIRGNKSHYKKLLSFSGWSLFGSLATTGANYGVSLLMNMFYGVVVNAAIGIAQQVNSAVSVFSRNLITAVNPQIVKSYAAKQYDYFEQLVINSSRYSYLLILLIALPVFVCCEECLSFWLTVVPEHSVSFCRIIILYTLLDSAQTPLYLSVQATGKIRDYQIIMSILFISILPLSYLVLKLGGSPEEAMSVRIGIIIIVFVARLIYLTKLYNFPVGTYLKSIIIKCGLPTFISVVASLILYRELYSIHEGVIVTFILSFVITAVSILFTGIRKKERQWLFKQAITFILKR